MRAWEEAVPYVQDYREWWRFAGILVLRLQEASKPGRDEKAWFNWTIYARQPDDRGNGRTFLAEGGAPTERGGKMEATRCARTLLKNAREAL